MVRILHYVASPRGELSKSKQISDFFIQELRNSRSNQQVDVREVSLFDIDLPAFGTQAAAAKMAVFAGEEQTKEQQDIWARARELFDEFQTADMYVFSVPFWNAGVPYILKQWIDLVTQPGWAFAFDPATGYSGLLEGKKAFTVYASGVYGNGVPHAFGEDFTRTFFEDWLDFVGVKSREHVLFGPNVVQADPDGLLTDIKQRAAQIAQKF
ncbi:MULTISPECIES: FMN-dependent NADH-azoreductase [Rothia]|uniref:FMN dependent NADH:quinone oxidoreductase n=1 Tax=Rothia nasimurium TaxID=85336 RepID=A0A1Y1RPZ9_9MICC|nr:MULTISPECIES: NAD(P)H-dependent oxidoreductase [Rothia]ORC18929.1 FMN-dependent NADH-azoreductase [Rothia nasimurium]